MRRVATKDGKHVFTHFAVDRDRAGHWLTSAAVCALVATALWFPKAPRERQLSPPKAPAAQALRTDDGINVTVRLNRDATPVFYSVCHRFQTTADRPLPYAVDYASCPVKRTQVRDAEQIALDLPTDVDTLLVEIWPLNRVEPARYIVTTPSALQRDGLQLN